MVLVLLVTSQLSSLWTSDKKSPSNNKKEDNERKITYPNKNKIKMQFFQYIKEMKWCDLN